MEKNIEFRVGLTVPKSLVKTVKDALQGHEKLEKHEKIRPILITDDSCRNNNQVSLPARADRYIIPTTSTYPNQPEPTHTEAIEIKESLLRLISLHHHAEAIDITFYPLNSPPSNPTKSKAPSLLALTLKRWLSSFPPSLLSPFDVSQFISHSHWSYTVYPPLLLLPRHTFSSPLWLDLTATTLKPHLPSLYTLLCATFKVTHIAINAPIPAFSPSAFPYPSSYSRSAEIDITETRQSPNILRAPHLLQPLYNNFGPSHPLNHIPTPTDFLAEFWCISRQNTIWQTWAPRHTMFSRGNISEKARLLSLDSLTVAGLGGKSPRDTSAVDLYAGVGYFAFSYAKSEVGKVLCWEINPWSVEGLRKGAEMNGWNVKIIQTGVGEAQETDKTKEMNGEENNLTVYFESNEHAARRINIIRESIPPIRHVNCGFLPTSQPSWATAVQALDPIQGGWIHVHENISTQSFNHRQKEITDIFKELVESNHHHHHHGKAPVSQWTVECVHFEQVKNFAPGVVHCVLDIAILRNPPPFGGPEMN